MGADADALVITREVAVTTHDPPAPPGPAVGPSPPHGHSGCPAPHPMYPWKRPPLDRAETSILPEPRE